MIPSYFSVGNKETTIQESAECTSESIMPPIEACMKTPNGSIALYTYASDSKDPISSIESLRTKAAKFILTGELDNLDENGKVSNLDQLLLQLHMCGTLIKMEAQL